MWSFNPSGIIQVKAPPPYTQFNYPVIPAPDAHRFELAYDGVLFSQQ
jgi:hypothetical protein